MEKHPKGSIDRSTKKVLTGLALLIVPGSAIVVGGILVYKGLKKMIGEKNDYRIFTRGAKDCESCDGAVQEVCDPVSKGKD